MLSARNRSTKGPQYLCSSLSPRKTLYKEESLQDSPHETVLSGVDETDIRPSFHKGSSKTKVIMTGEVDMVSTTSERPWGHEYTFGGVVFDSTTYGEIRDKISTHEVYTSTQTPSV